VSNCPKCGEALVDELIEAAMEYANEHGPDEDYRRWAKEKLDGAKAACVAMVHTLTQDFADQRRRAELAESMLSHREEELTFVKAALDTALRDTARLDKAEVSNPTASSDHPFALQDASPERERLAGIRPDLCATIDEHVALTWDCVPARRSEVVRSICETWARRLQLAEAAATFRAPVDRETLVAALYAVRNDPLTAWINGVHHDNVGRLADAILAAMKGVPDDR